MGFISRRFTSTLLKNRQKQFSDSRLFLRLWLTQRRDDDFMFIFSSSLLSLSVWDDIVVAEEGSYATLVCIDKTVGGAVAVNWMLKSSEADQWKLLLSADRMKQFSGVASKHWMGLIDPNFQESGVFSLGLYPKLKDGGLYSCLVRQQGRKVKEKIILLSVLRGKKSVFTLVTSTGPVHWSSPLVQSTGPVYWSGPLYLLGLPVYLPAYSTAVLTPGVCPHQQSRSSRPRW